MFECACPSCGRRELRGPRSLLVRDQRWWAVCRQCGADVAVAGHRQATTVEAAAA